jgi:hypothetical protein
MRSQVVWGFIAGVTLILGLGGCSKKSGKAEVLEKEHIAVREFTPTPAPQKSASPGDSTPASTKLASEDDSKALVLAEDEVVVDTYVMKKDVRGTSRDPRATIDEQWIVRIRMLSDLRQIKVQTDKRHWDKVKIGDRISVSYREGNYTGTVWSAEID